MQSKVIKIKDTRFFLCTLFYSLGASHLYLLSVMIGSLDVLQPVPLNKTATTTTTAATATETSTT